MQQKGENDWTTVLQDAVTIYNNRIHRSINTTPNKASLPDNKSSVIKFMEEQAIKKMSAPKSQYKFNIGDSVRIKLDRGPFSKGHEPLFSEAIYFINSRLFRDNVDYYNLKSHDGEVIDGSFIVNELTPVTVDESTEYKIEEVLPDRKKANGKYYRLVKWLGYKERSWVLEEDIKDL